MRSGLGRGGGYRSSRDFGFYSEQEGKSSEGFKHRNYMT